MPTAADRSARRFLQVFPAIDIRGGQCVRLRQGDYAQETVFAEDPVEMAWRWADHGADWLHLVDLDGARAGQPVNHATVARIVEKVGIPCQLGGGLRTQESIHLLLEEIGVARVILGTQALKQPDWFRQMAAIYPNRLALGIDARDSLVATDGWLDVSQTSALQLARQYLDVDLAAVIYTNIANDGMMQGIDAATIDDLIQLADLGFPVIASGGVTTVEDIDRLVCVSKEHPNVIGVIIGRALYEGTIDITAALQAAKKP